MIVAVIGLGSIGTRHARNLESLGHDVVGYDPAGERRAALEAEGCRTVPTRAAALDAAEAVVIASPTACHSEDLAAVAEAGRHVFVEKPIAHTDAGLEALLKALDSGGLTVFVGMNYRFDPTVLTACRMIAEGRIGEPLWSSIQTSDYLPGWRPHQDYRRGYAADPVSGGVLFDLVHEFDLANMLLGPSETIAAAARRTGALDFEAEDCADVVLRHDSGAHSSLHLDFVTRPRRRITYVAGTAANLEMRMDDRSLLMTDGDGRPVDEQTMPGHYDDDYIAEIAAFVRCVQDGDESPPCDGWAGLAVLRQVLVARHLSGLPVTQ